MSDDGKPPGFSGITDARTSHLLGQLYGSGSGGVQASLDTLLAQYAAPARSRVGSRGRLPLTAADVMLITYGDQVGEPGVPPLRTLAGFCEQHLRGIVSAIHLLPHYPYTSDDGFAVTDYRAVNPDLGTWADVTALGGSFDLMFDAVFNHLSAQSEWFQRFLDDDPAFRDFFVTVAGHPDLAQVVRPRALPLLTRFASASGPRQVWTTFSADQVDLNVRNPAVLLALLDTLLFYVARGARFLRLDAIAYLWKEIGTPCIHLPQTHAVIQLMRAVLDRVAPETLLITETNVPHRDNVAYFGDGTNEAQLVYNFALPPLILHALLRGEATHLARWAALLRLPSDQVTFFNFTASHDGIGLNPARGILPAAEIDFLVERCQAHGGFLSYKDNPDGSRSPYELNIVYFDALSNPAAGEDLDLQVNRFLVSQAIMLALPGLPGIYVPSLLGSRNDRDAALASGIPRRINRRKFIRAELERELADSDSLRSRVFRGYRRLLAARVHHLAFGPLAHLQVLQLPSTVFGLLRSTPDETLLALHNLTREPVTLRLPAEASAQRRAWRSRLAPPAPPFRETVTLAPYEVVWADAAG